MYQINDRLIASNSMHLFCPIFLNYLERFCPIFRRKGTKKSHIHKCYAIFCLVNYFAVYQILKVDKKNVFFR